MTDKLMQCNNPKCDYKEDYNLYRCYCPKCGYSPAASDHEKELQQMRQGEVLETPYGYKQKIGKQIFYYDKNDR